MKEYVKQRFPLQGMVRRQVIHEGTDPHYQSEFQGEFEDEVTKLKKFSADAHFQKDELRDMSLSDVFQRFLDTVGKMGEKVEIASIQDLDDKLTEKGQIASVSKEFTPDDILKSLDTVLISFDKDGKAQLPTFMGGEEASKKIAEAFKKLDEEPYLTKFRDLIEKKKREWDARENSRKLVD
ncbi:hypothetical protein [Rhodohalobacter mucosus]|nr:hypothetical protein [Rhodohalobacter mucosus]